MEGQSGFCRARRARTSIALACVLLAFAVLAACSAEEPSMGYSPGQGRAAPSDGRGAGLAASPSTTPAEVRMPEGASTTVRTLFAVPVKGESVVLSGRVIEMLAHNDFVLDDGTGAIHVAGDETCTGFGVGDVVLVDGVVHVGDSPFRVEVEAVEVDIR
ncbi:MAG: hypothetical protein K0B85_06900 [Coriobacteriia bacterium]|nr:hypothetical protein [Coriobacteriia bacterium]